MENTKEIFDKLCDFIIQEYWGNKERMTLETTVEKDLGITGDDGTEFLEKFITHFHIQYDENKEYHSYFDAEGLDLLNLRGFYNWLLGKNNTQYYDLTLGHLVKIIQLGYWVEMK